MKENFNKLTPAETERLSVLVEELAEGIHICGKILRHGYDSHDPTKEHIQSNRDLLIFELGDIECAKDMLINAGDLGIQTGYDNVTDKITRAKYRKLHKIKSYLHHQKIV